MDAMPTMVFALMCELLIARGLPPPRTVDGCVQIAVDDKWHLTFNGHKTPQPCEGQQLEPFHTYVKYNGWPAGIFSPFGGIVAAGAAANEQTLIVSLESAIAAALGGDDGSAQ